MILNQSQFSGAVGVSRAAIGKAVKAGRVAVGEDGMIDTSHGINQAFISGDARRVANFNNYAKNEKKDDVKPNRKKTVKPPVNEQQEHDAVEREEKTEERQTGSVLSDVEVQRQKNLAAMIRAKEQAVSAMIDNKVKRDELGDREMISFVIERFINKFITGVKTISNTSLRDIEKNILHNGGLVNSDFILFEDAHMELVDTAKKGVQEDLKKFKK